MGSVEKKFQDHLHNHFLEVIRYLLDNPSPSPNHQYEIDSILDLGRPLLMEAGDLFMIMSSSAGISEKRIEEFKKNYPSTKEFFSTLGSNRKQFAILFFQFLLQYDELKLAIHRKFVRNSVDNLFDCYRSIESLIIRKALFLEADNKLKSKIIIFDDNPEIRKLRHS